VKLLALVALSLVAGAKATPPATVTSAVHPFSITLERNGSLWSATCTKGCQWTAVSVRCRGMCAVIVDDQGLRTLASGRLPDEQFAFTAEADGSGWRARSYVGTAWLALGYTCGIPGICRAHVNEHGVSGL
jgi:hypothetical protein